MSIITSTEITNSGNLKIFFDNNTFIDVGRVLGNDGIDGQIGNKGEQGIQGFRGEKGSKGEMGRNGLNGEAGGIDKFINLLDTPNEYINSKFLVGNSSSTGIEYTGIVIGSGNNNVISNSTILGRYAGFELLDKNIGRNNSLYGTQSGYNLKGNNNTFIGSNSGISANLFDNNICIGYNSCFQALNGSDSIILGSDTNLGNSAISNSSIIIGNKSTINSNYSCSNIGKSIILGYNSSIDSCNSILIGDNSISLGYLPNDRNHILIGFNNEITSTTNSGNTTENCITIGNQSKINSSTKSTNNSICIGYKSYIENANNSISIISNSYDEVLENKIPGVYSDNSIAIGNSVYSNGLSSISIGTLSNSEGEFSIAIGGSLNNLFGAKSTNKHSIAIGTNSVCQHDNSICIGKDSESDIINQFCLPDYIRDTKIGGINYKWPNINNSKLENSVLTIDNENNLSWKSLNDNLVFKNSLSNSYEHYNYIFTTSKEIIQNKIYFNKFFMNSNSKFSKITIYINNNNKLFNIKVAIYENDNINNLPKKLLIYGEKYIDENINNFINIDLNNSIELNMNSEYYVALLYNSINIQDKLEIYSYENQYFRKNNFINKTNEYNLFPDIFLYETEEIKDTYWFRLLV